MNKPRVTNILKAGGLINFDMVPKDILDRACAFGSAVHLATQLDDLGTLDINSVDSSIMGYLESWRKFCKDYDLSFTKDEIEHRYTSKRGFTGMPDRISKAKGLLLDIKTGSGVYHSVDIQTAAYQILAEENGIKIKKRMCVQLMENRYKIYPLTETSDKSVFLSCLNIYNFKKRHNMLDKRVT